MRPSKISIVIVGIFLINTIHINGAMQRLDNMKKDIMTQTKHLNPLKITTVIFDLEGVLFQENKPAFAQKIGLGTLTKYALINWANPETTCLNALHAISTNETNQPSVPLIHRGKHMPRCIVDWQLGNASHTQVRNELNEQLEQLGKNNYFRNEQEKEITKKIIDVSIDPDNLIELAKPVNTMISLAKQLKASGYKLYILSNLAQEQDAILRKEFSELEHIFDDIIISAKIKMLKPHKEIYQHLLRTYNLTSQECVFIDNQKDNIEGAQKLGLHGIVHKNARSTKAQLAKLGVR